jgi:hypothetical protein
METKQSGVEIDIAEEGDDTRVRAILTTLNGTTIEGTGHARRNPADRTVPEIGDELATGRAILDIGYRLVQLATTEITAAAQRGAT